MFKEKLVRFVVWLSLLFAYGLSAFECGKLAYKALSTLRGLSEILFVLQGMGGILIGLLGVGFLLGVAFIIMIFDIVMDLNEFRGLGLQWKWKCTTFLRVGCDLIGCTRFFAHFCWKQLRFGLLYDIIYMFIG